jgi:hypothetical protein
MKITNLIMAAILVFNFNKFQAMNNEEFLPPEMKKYLITSSLKTVYLIQNPDGSFRKRDENIQLHKTEGVSLNKIERLPIELTHKIFSGMPLKGIINVQLANKNFSVIVPKYLSDVLYPLFPQAKNLKIKEILRIEALFFGRCLTRHDIALVNNWFPELYHNIVYVVPLNNPLPNLSVCYPNIPKISVPFYETLKFSSSVKIPRLPRTPIRLENSRATTKIINLEGGLYKIVPIKIEKKETEVLVFCDVTGKMVPKYSEI